MRNFKSRKSLFFFILLMLSFIITPVLGIGVINNRQLTNSNQNFERALNSCLSQDNKKIAGGTFDPDSYDINKISIYDKSLKDFLNSIPLLKECNPKYVKIVVLFDTETTKQGRINIIRSILEDYQIIYNYNIIPGICINATIFELIQKANLFKSISSIQKIYKSNTYKNPVIIENSINPSALSVSNYDNWWVTAIGADNVGGLDGSGVNVAVLDTGIYDHPDLNYIPSSLTARNFVAEEPGPQNYNDSNGHGTHVAGIIGGNGGASSGKYRGIAPGATLINARAGTASGSLEDVDVIAAIEWCVETAHADIISMSFGGGEPNAYDLMTLAISNASDQGVISVVSAGNSGPGYFTGGSPASGIDAICVGATDRNNKLASFSSWGPTYSYLAYVDIVAPGVNIISTLAPDSVISSEMNYIDNFFDFPGDKDYVPLSGTSMSAPVVSGALAILKQKYPLLTPETARIALLQGAKPLSNETFSMEYGAGLINITASLSFLDSINSTFGNVNQTAIFSPSELPLKPFDLLHFPGDHLKYNITIISGEANTYDITIPTIPSGITAIFDKSQIDFDNASVGFVALDILINKDTPLGNKSFLINLNDTGGALFDSLNVSFNVRLPEFKILMESFHGLNDMDLSPLFDQIGYYEAMNDLIELNISIDYEREHWTPDYDPQSNNSILTEERLAQYDLVVLQNPILPYSSIELSALVDYFNTGGNLLLFGTRYQDITTDNLNNLLNILNVDIQLNEENVISADYNAIGANINTQSVTNFNSPIIFNGVSKFLWYYGNTFTISSKATSIATLNGKTVAASYNGTTYGKGNLITFGSTDWIYYDYNAEDYSQDHSKLLANLIEYFFPNTPYSINIALRSERINNPKLNISVYVKNNTANIPLSSGILNSNLTVEINHPIYSAEMLTMNSLNDGIAYNYTYDLPGTDYRPFTITVNLTIGSIFYIKNSKILYYDPSGIPTINNFNSTESSISRSTTNSISVNLGTPNHNAISYIALFPNSFFSTHKTIYKTLILTGIGNIFSGTFIPTYTDPAGLAIYYLVANRTTSNYINPNSPRRSFIIQNTDPQIRETSSYIKIGTSSIRLDTTHTTDSNYVFSTKQLDEIEFTIDAYDNVYEDSDAELTIFVSLFIGSVIGNAVYLNLIPTTIQSIQLTYVDGKHTGIYTVPKTMTYSTIEGLNEVSTEVNLYDGYVGVFFITVIDSEGGTPDDPTTIFFTISSVTPNEFPIVLILIIVGVILLGIVIIIIIHKKTRKAGVSHKWEDYDS